MPDSPTGGRWQDRADRHAPLAALHPAQRSGDFYYPPDPDTDDYCPACTPELGEHGWQHDRACPRRQRRTA